MVRFHRIASAVALALVTVALLAPVAQARPATAGGAAAPATSQTGPAGPGQESRQGNGGTDWNAVFAGAAGSVVIIAMAAGGVGLLRRRTLAA
jgi:hypothetical protein